MRVVLTGDARTDLSEIGDYIALDSRFQATRFVRMLRDKCNGIGSSPRGYPIIEGRADKEQMRRRPVGNYTIYFYIEANTVIVARVLHAARDFEKVLFPEES